MSSVSRDGWWFEINSAFRADKDCAEVTLRLYIPLSRGDLELICAELGDSLEAEGWAKKTR